MSTVTIVVPAFNAGKTLKDTLNSILAQTYTDWDLIVVDDGSQDDTFSIAEEYSMNDERIHTIHQENKGSAGAYNTGISAAETTWICICSADDLLMPDHLETVAKAIERSEGDAVFTTSGARYLQPDGSMIIDPVEPLDDSYHEEFPRDVARRGLYGVGAVYKKEMFEKLGGYTEHIYSEDHDLWLRAFAAGYRFLHIYSSTTIYRISATQKSADNDRVIKSQEEIVNKVLAGDIESDEVRRGIIEGAALRKAETDAYYASLDAKASKFNLGVIKSKIKRGPKIVTAPLGVLYRFARRVVRGGHS